MGKIIFLPVPEFGHIIPPLKLAKALKQRGHSIYYLGLADFEDYVRSQGLEYISFLKRRYPKGFFSMRAEKQSKMRLDRLSLMLLEAEQSNDSIAANPMAEIEKEIATILQEMKPDLLIVDNMLRDLAAVAAYKLGAPTIILSLHFEEARTRLIRRDEPPPKSKLPVIVLCPKEIDFSMAPRSDNYYYLEASIEVDRKEATNFPWDKVDASKPLIYCSFGSQPNAYEQSEDLFRVIAEALKQRPQWQLVLAVGAHLNAADFDCGADNVLVVNWAPQLEMLKRARMMITHGGLGAVKECIYFGVPMIVFPGSWDQPHHAARVVYHGLGVRGNIHDRSVGQVHSLIDAVEKAPMLKRKVEAMSKTFRQIESSGIGVRTVEKLLDDYRKGPGVMQESAADR